MAFGRDCRRWPVPGNDYCVRGECKQLLADTVYQSVMISPQISSSYRTPEQAVAAEHKLLLRTIQRNAARSMAGHSYNLQATCADIYDIAVLQRHVYDNRLRVAVHSETRLLPGNPAAKCCISDICGKPYSIFVLHIIESETMVEVKMRVDNLNQMCPLLFHEPVKGFLLLRIKHAGIDGNGQTEFVYGLTGLEKLTNGKITLDGKDITHATIRQRSKDGMSHIPEDRHKHGLVLDYSLENNMVLQRYWQPEFQKGGFIRSDKVREYSDRLIAQYDVRSGQGSSTIVRSMSGGNQQKAIIAREIDRDPKLLIAVQPTRGLDVGAIEYIHSQIVAERDKGKAVLLVSLELDEVMNLSDRILVMYEGEIVGEFDPKTTTVQELGLYMAGARKQGKETK